MAETIDVTPVTSAGTEAGRDVSAHVTVSHVLYALHAFAPFTLWTLAVVAMIIGVVKRDEVRGTWLDTHFSWLAHTFWWGLFWVIVTMVGLTLFGVITLGLGFLLAWFFFLPVTIWYWYRIIRGWLKLNDLKPVP